MGPVLFGSALACAPAGAASQRPRAGGASLSLLICSTGRRANALRASAFSFRSGTSFDEDQGAPSHRKHHQYGGDPPRNARIPIAAPGQEDEEPIDPQVFPSGRKHVQPAIPALWDRINPRWRTRLCDSQGRAQTRLLFASIVAFLGVAPTIPRRAFLPRTGIRQPSGNDPSYGHRDRGRGCSARPSQGAGLVSSPRPTAPDRPANSGPFQDQYRRRRGRCHLPGTHRESLRS